jgi:hypothetical protein
MAPSALRVYDDVEALLCEALDAELQLDLPARRRRRDDPDSHHATPLIAP